ncbi:MAG TPA: hypothetical protein ENG40_04505 [Thermoprotei archaeon]|nr:hypothetical protein [Thermoprotei archaeon]
MENKVVLVSGPSGCQIYEKLSEVKRLAESRNKRIYLIRIFDEMRKIEPRLDERTILNYPTDKLQSLRSEAIREIKNRMEKEEGLFLIRTPVVFYWSGNIIYGLSYNDIEILDPDLFLVIIEDVMRVKYIMKKDPQWSMQSFSLRELVFWRADEIARTQEFARWRRKDFYIIPREHSVEVIYDIIVNRGFKKVIYISFPISGVPPAMLEKLLEAKDNFIEKINKKYIVLDPYTIKEGILSFKLEEALRNNLNKISFSMKYSEGLQHFIFEREEVMEAIDAIERQIVERDLNMVESADIVVFFNPIGVLSPGAACEMMHGYRLGKRVYMLWGGESRPSPFYTANCHKIFKREEDLVEYLLK